MEYTLLLFVVAEIYSVEIGLPPDIFLKGNSFTKNNSTVFQFICSTNIAVWQCSVEFLIEKRTHNDIRYVDNKCYHTYGICPPDMCACSDSCKSFTWNVTVIEDMKNHSYSCVANMVTGEVKFLANITVKWNDKTGFETIKHTIVPIDTVIQQSTTPKSESVKLIIISTSVGSATCIFSFIVLSLTCRKLCRDKTKKDPPPARIINDNTIFRIPVQFDLTSQQLTENTPSNEQNPNYKQAQQDSSNKTSYDREPNTRLEGPQSQKNAPSHGHTQEYTQDALQLRKPLPITFDRTMGESTDDFRHQPNPFDDLCQSTENQNATPKKSPSTVSYSAKSDRNSTAKKSPSPVSYSALSVIGNRSSTSTQSSGTSAHKIKTQYKIRPYKKKKRVIMRRKGVGESDV